MGKSKGKKQADKALPAPAAKAKSYATLSDLRADRDICIKSDKASENRTLQTVDPLYISTPYFTPEEADAIKAVIVDSETKTTLEQAISKAMENFIEKRRASGDARPCGPHDMVLVYLEWFGVEKGEIDDEKFVGRVGRSGLGT